MCACRGGLRGCAHHGVVCVVISPVQSLLFPPQPLTWSPVTSTSAFLLFCFFLFSLSFFLKKKNSLELIILLSMERMCNMQTTATITNIIGKNVADQCNTILGCTGVARATGAGCELIRIPPRTMTSGCKLRPAARRDPYRV